MHPGHEWIRALLRTVSRPIVHAWAVRSNVSIGRRVHIGHGTVLWAPNELCVSDDVYVGRRCTIECDGTIGAGTLIANHVGIVGRRDHDVRTLGVAASSAPWVGDGDARHPGRTLRVDIGPDVWIGYGAVILSGVSIGRGAVIGAGAVVTASVEPYQVVAGNPARVVGVRFTPEQQAIHEQMLLCNSCREDVAVERLE